MRWFTKGGETALGNGGLRAGDAISEIGNGRPRTDRCDPDGGDAAHHGNPAKPRSRQKEAAHYCRSRCHTTRRRPCLRPLSTRPKRAGSRSVSGPARTDATRGKESARTRSKILKTGQKD